MCRDNGKAVIRSGGPSTIIGVIFLVAALGMMVAFYAELASGGTVEINGRPTDASSPAAWFPFAFFSIFVIFGSVMAIYGRNARYEIDDNGLKQFDWLGRLVAQVYWPDVKWYGMSAKPANPNGRTGLRFALTVRRQTLELSTQRDKVQIPIRYGWPLVDCEILRHVPQFKLQIGAAAGEISRSRREIPPDGLVFRQWAYVFVALLLIAFGGFAAISCLTMKINNLPPASPQNMPFVAIGMLILLSGFVVVLYIVNGRTVLTENEIMVYDLLGRVKDSIYWKDVKAFEYETMSSSGNDGTTYFYILRTDDRYIRFNDRQTSWTKLRDAIIGMLPPDARVYMPSMGIN